MEIRRIVLVRHGQSTWNLENRFTGWTDVPLTEQGMAEAKKAGKLLLDKGFQFTQAHTSYLKRAIKTLNIILEEMDRLWVPVEKAWQLNEKHYGTLQGLNKAETAAKYGDDQVKIWRRSYSVAPPALETSDERHPVNSPAYQGLGALPGTESLEDTIARALPYWENNIYKGVDKHKDILVVAHGNSLRGVIKVLKNLSEEQILELNLPTGIPYVFEFNKEGHVVNDYFLGDPEEIAKLMAEVANQGSTKK